MSDDQSDDLREVDLPDGGPYPLPDVIERPLAMPAAGVVPPQPTRDPSYSNAVDRAAAGVPVEDAGYDRPIEGPKPTE